MQTTDWNFNFSSLPYWNNRNSIPFVYDEFFEIPQNDSLCCIYSISEVSMCNPLGFLAIIKNKQNPHLYLNVTDGIAFSPIFSLNNDGNLIFLQPNIYYKDTNTIKRPILIIDISKNIFSFFPTDNHNPCYTVSEVNKNVFKIKADPLQKKHDKLLKALSKKKIKINALNWFDLNTINLLPQMI